MRIKVTERNAASVMGKLNAFFRHGVSELMSQDLSYIENDESFLSQDHDKLMLDMESSLVGFHKSRIECAKDHLKRFNESNTVVKRDRVHNLVWFHHFLNTTYCDWHYLLKERRSGDDTRIRLFTHQDNIPLLAVCQEKCESCLPIHTGDIVEFKGTRVIIHSRYGKNYVRLNASSKTYVTTKYSLEAIQIIDRRYFKNLAISTVLDECEMYSEYADWDSSESRVNRSFRSLLDSDQIDDNDVLELKGIDCESDLDVDLLSILLKFTYNENRMEVGYQLQLKNGEVMEISSYPKLIDLLSYKLEEGDNTDDDSDGDADWDYCYGDCCGDGDD